MARRLYRAPYRLWLHYWVRLTLTDVIEGRLLNYGSSSAITIGLGQIPAVLGFSSHVNSSDPAYLIFISIFKHLRKTRMDAVTGLSALLALYMIKSGCGRAAKRWPTKSRPIFFFSTLRTVLILLLFTLISFIVNHQSKKHPKFRIIGHIPSGKIS
jgi:sodium-independent sulfate anion transporter 11